MQRTRTEFMLNRNSNCMTKFYYKDKDLKFLIDEDVIGYYLIIYKDPNSEISSQDYVFDSLEDAFQEAEEKFGVKKELWMHYK